MEPVKMPGGCGLGGMRRNERSGMRSHCSLGGRLNGYPNTDFSQRSVPSCFTVFGGTTCSENEGVQRRRLRNVTLPTTLRFAKTCCGSDISSWMPRIIIHELTPEIPIAASIAETMMNKRLLLVFSAAMPRMITKTM